MNEQLIVKITIILTTPCQHSLAPKNKTNKVINNNNNLIANKANKAEKW